MYLCIFKCLGLCIAIWLGFCYLHSAISLCCLLLCDQSVVSTRFSLIVFVFLWQGVICVKQNSPSLFSFSPFGRQNGFAPWSSIVYGNNINSSAEQLVFNLQVHLCLFRSPINHWLFILTSVGISQNTFKLTLWPFFQFFILAALEVYSFFRKDL